MLEVLCVINVRVNVPVKSALELFADDVHCTIKKPSYSSTLQIKLYELGVWENNLTWNFIPKSVKLFESLIRKKNNPSKIHNPWREVRTGGIQNQQFIVTIISQLNLKDTF